MMELYNQFLKSFDLNIVRTRSEVRVLYLEMMLLLNKYYIHNNFSSIDKQRIDEIYRCLLKIQNSKKGRTNLKEITYLIKKGYTKFLEDILEADEKPYHFS